MPEELSCFISKREVYTIRFLTFVCFLSLVLILSEKALAASRPAPNHIVFSYSQSVDGQFDHGGGCRKDSLPGQCCHMDRRLGSIHCH